MSNVESNLAILTLSFLDNFTGSIFSIEMRTGWYSSYSFTKHWRPLTERTTPFLFISLLPACEWRIVPKSTESRQCYAYKGKRRKYESRWTNVPLTEYTTTSLLPCSTFSHSQFYSLRTYTVITDSFLIFHPRRLNHLCHFPLLDFEVAKSSVWTSYLFSLKI